MKRKEKETYWIVKIEEYRASGLSLIEWCETSDVALHNMKYWLRKQSPINRDSSQETSWVSCVVEEPKEKSISLRIDQVDIEVTSGYDETLLLQVIRTLRLV
ncbi:MULTISPECIES: IS66 family insertion sequence element accessory protein TnpB [Exiguobacterium]|uniref:IS66 family insertion sequence element accessory protein TnpB n=1 Tax=Exiguobacterium profundum TaxID=307643 RepID=A0ABY8AXV4_9BACL|nr:MULTISPECIES: IS66 family insertion sequence element accessory protein TnpB [Exiguobacterium]WED54516.1 IS66 family insertion sequence element accessory protein TnpB [Exiguobacterium profundum]